MAISIICRNSSKRLSQPGVNFKTIVLTFLVIAAFISCRQPSEISYSGPIEIKKGGVYTGNYKSDDSNIPAITVSTYDSVEITGCNIVSAGIGIKAFGGSRLTIHHNNISGLPPTGNQWGRALDDYHPQFLVFENNNVHHTGGLVIDHSDENTKSAVIRFNKFINTDNRKGDFSVGDHRAAILFNSVLPILGEISWNYFHNELDSSSIEDNINLGNSGGSKDSSFLIHDNFIWGAYPSPATSGHFTGSGISIEGEPGHNAFNNVSQYIKIFNNQVISTCNAGINISHGHDITAQFNTIISSGMYPNGDKSDRFWGGCAIWNPSKLSPDVFKDITIKNNTIGYVRPGMNVPLPNRQDYVVVPGSPINVQPGDNTALPNPITLQTELDQVPIWEKKLADNKIIIGNTTSNGKPMK
ncbi:MAG: right-handed parallel beta-helix repeat-containing protein [Chitinophagaceae bacterium]